MPLVSFSIPQMLPYVWRGLEQADAKFSDGASDWFQRKMDLAHAAGLEGSQSDRVKRQTIRARNDGKRSAWATAKQGDTLYIWWKQRVDGERFFIGTVPLKVVWMVSYGPGTLSRFEACADCLTHMEPWSLNLRCRRPADCKSNCLGRNDGRDKEANDHRLWRGP